MKKILCVLAAIAGLTMYVNAKSAFGGLEKLAGGKNEAAVGEIPDGREVFPVIWKYTHSDLTGGDAKVISANANIKRVNVIDNQYTFGLKIIFKFGIGLQCQESNIVVTVDGKSFIVNTERMVTYNVDKNGKRTSDPLDNAAKSLAQNSVNIKNDLEKDLKELSEDDYQKWYNSAFYDIDVQAEISNYAANKLKAKRWYQAHPIEGKDVEFDFFFTSIDESKEPGYAYKLSGMVGFDPEKSILCYFFSNDDKYLDTQDNQFIHVKGNVKKVSYSDSDFYQEYKILSFVVQEK